jgi:hypothetical protein
LTKPARRRRAANHEEAQMPVNAVFGLGVALSFLAFGIVAWLYVWPRLKAMPREDALAALAAPHMFRSVGLSFLVTGVVSPALPSAFAAPAAYGDLVAAILAMVATLALSARLSWAVAAAWLLNVWGSLDVIFAFYQGQIGVGIAPGSLGAAYYIPTMAVPPLLLTHALMFALLLRRGERRPEGPIGSLGEPGHSAASK